MKKYNWIITLASVVGVIVAQRFICQPDYQNYCTHTYYIRYYPYVLFGSASVFLISLILYFVRKEVFKAWLIFSAWFIPLSYLLVYLAPDIGQDYHAPFDKKLVGYLAVFIFFILSIIIIAVKSGSLPEEKSSSRS